MHVLGLVRSDRIEKFPSLDRTVRESEQGCLIGISATLVVDGLECAEELAVTLVDELPGVKLIEPPEPGRVGVKTEW
jgi:hypothetical protein